MSVFFPVGFNSTKSGARANTSGGSGAQPNGTNSAGTNGTPGVSAICGAVCRLGLEGVKLNKAAARVFFPGFVAPFNSELVETS